MSQTLQATAFNVRRMLKDTNLSQPVNDTPFTLYRAIIRAAQLLSEQAGCARVWSAALFTSTAGSSADIALSATLAFQSIIDVWDTSLGQPLRRRSLPEINAMREGITATNLPTGIPIDYALYEGAANITYLRFGVVPQLAIAYDVEYRAVLPTAYADSTALDFAPGLLRGIEYHAAAEVGESLMPPDCADLGFNQRVIDRWFAKADKCANDERARAARLTRGAFGVGAILGT